MWGRWRSTAPIPTTLTGCSSAAASACACRGRACRCDRRSRACTRCWLAWRQRELPCSRIPGPVPGARRHERAGRPAVVAGADRLRAVGCKRPGWPFSRADAPPIRACASPSRCSPASRRCTASVCLARRPSSTSPTRSSSGHLLVRPRDRASPSRRRPSSCCTARTARWSSPPRSISQLGPRLGFELAPAAGPRTTDRARRGSRDSSDRRPADSTCSARGDVALDAARLAMPTRDDRSCDEHGLRRARAARARSRRARARRVVAELADSPELWIAPGPARPTQRLYEELFSDAHLTAWLICWSERPGHRLSRPRCLLRGRRVVGGRVREQR